MDREEKVERNWTVHPGRHLANFLEDHRLSKRKLAEQMQVSVAEIDDLLAGGEISKEIARRLDRVTGVRGFWARLERRYKKDLFRLAPRDEPFLKNIDRFFLLRGTPASIIKNDLAQKIREDDPENGPERATELQGTNDYIIRIELHGGKWDFHVTVGAGRGTYVAFGPNAVARFFESELTKKPKAVMKSVVAESPAKYEYAYAG